MNQFILSLFVIFTVGFVVLYLYLVFRHLEKVKLINLASYIGLGITFFLVLHITILMVYPIKIQEVELPLVILNDNKEVGRGEFLKLQVHIKKFIDKESIVHPSIICENGYYYVYPSITSNLPMGEQTFTVANIYQIPLNAPINECKVRATDHFQLNIFRGISYVQESEEFRIIE
jgi:hypothetical protein